MLVLVLDRSHNCLLEDGRLPVVASDGGPRPLVAVDARFTAAGVTLPAPSGSRLCPDGRDFVFVTAGFEAPAGFAWRRLRDAAADDPLWDLYVACLLGGAAPPTRSVDVWSFGNEPEMASRLLHLVLCGEKRVTMAWVDAAAPSGTPLPVEGGVSVVTDAFGHPHAILRTLEVRQVPFAEVDAASAAAEGEGDLTHADWREGHLEYFSGEAARYGLAFDDRSLIAVERFEVVSILGKTAREMGTCNASSPMT